jgi:hypothetical protein
LVVFDLLLRRGCDIFGQLGERKFSGVIFIAGMKKPGWWPGNDILFKNEYQKKCQLID